MAACFTNVKSQDGISKSSLSMTFFVSSMCMYNFYKIMLSVQCINIECLIHRLLRQWCKHTNVYGYTFDYITSISYHIIYSHIFSLKLGCADNIPGTNIYTFKFEEDTQRQFKFI